MSGSLVTSKRISRRVRGTPPDIRLTIREATTHHYMAVPKTVYRIFLGLELFSEKWMNFIVNEIWEINSMISYLLVLSENSSMRFECLLRLSLSFSSASHDDW